MGMVAVGGLHPHLAHRAGRVHLPQQAPQQFLVDFAITVE